MDYYSLKPKRITLLLRSHLIHKTIAVTATGAKLLSKCCCHGSKLFILVWCEVVYPHRFSVLRLCSPSARRLLARYRGLEDSSLRPFFSPNSLRLYSPPLATFSHAARLRRRLASVPSLSFFLLLFPSFSFVFLRFSSLFFAFLRFPSFFLE